jgi:hypothetical protein
MHYACIAAPVCVHTDCCVHFICMSRPKDTVQQPAAMTQYSSQPASCVASVCTVHACEGSGVTLAGSIIELTDISLGISSECVSATEGALCSGMAEWQVLIMAMSQLYGCSPH